MLAIVTTHPIQYQTPIWCALANEGRVPFQVWFLTDFGTRPSSDPQFGKTFRWDIDTLSGYPYRFLKSADGATPANFWRCRLGERLRDRLRASGVKAVWIQGWQVAGYWQAVREARAAGVEVWVRGDSNDLGAVPWWKQHIKRTVLEYLFSRIHRFFYVGSGNRRLYRKFGVCDAKLFPAPHAVDNERFAQQADAVRAQRDDIRRQWGIRNDAYCVLFCGKFTAQKRPMDLVLAAQALKASDRLSNIHLLFVGAGGFGAELRAACKVIFDAEGVSIEAAATGAPQATFTGFLNQTEISRAYVAADCLVLPGVETWGLVVNEAMASGLSCIASDACGCAEDLVGQDWSFPLGNIAALADRIAALYAAGSQRPMRPLPSLAETVATVSQAYAALSQS